MTLMGVKFVGKQEFLTRFSMCVRSKTTSAQYLATRFRDPTFEKLMDNYKNLVKVIAIQDLILANPKNRSVSIDFLRKFPHIFHIYYDPSKLKPFCRLTDTALDVSWKETVPLMLLCLLLLMDLFGYCQCLHPE